MVGLSSADNLLLEMLSGETLSMISCIPTQLAEMSPRLRVVNSSCILVADADLKKLASPTLILFPAHNPSQ